MNAIQLVADYPSEEFTETYHIHYAHIQSARYIFLFQRDDVTHKKIREYLIIQIYLLHRIAKRFIDNKNFFGGILHVCYAPELETLEETKAKLVQRRKDVATQIKRIQQESVNLETDKFIPRYV